MYVKLVEAAMFYYVKCKKKKLHYLKFLNFPPPAGPVRPDVTGTGTQKPDAGIGRRRWPGTLQGTHRGSTEQGK
ncbi:unnamed protein product [Staurois parvus]|uniref:Uncharacterized protein n=2 Tax=Staurois parvus TaxID=386267 RepID=A0ABN9D585_9NEOB|nr:unnamed protein product [Staurois parvus]